MTKRAFTLVELLVVTGIIASMATIGIGSYGAIKRGMANRGALAAATSVISLAQDRARIDMSPTVVYFMNELIQMKGDVKQCAGVAIAIRRAGRVSRYFQDRLYDEYAGLEKTYPLAGSGSDATDSGFRLYRFNKDKIEFSVARSSVVAVNINSSLVPENWCMGVPVNTAQLEGLPVVNGSMLVYAFDLKDSKGVNWKIGDAYAYEFARIRLPDGYVFGSTLPSSTSDPVKDIGSPMVFRPSDSYSASLKTIDVSALQTDGSYKVIGSAGRKTKEI